MKKIMFNEPFGLQQATFDGTKTMTRRIVPDKTLDKWYEFEEYYRMTAPMNIPCYIEPMEDFLIRHAPYNVGEVVAIAQSYNSFIDHWIDCRLIESAGFRNKMFVKAERMPHHIEILGRKVELLQDISDEDCLKEGIMYDPKGVAKYGYRIGEGKSKWYRTPKDAFSSLIDKVSGKGTWESNPLVFAYEYKRID